MSAAVYAEVVEATIARLREAEARPTPVYVAIPHDPSRALHFCTGCDLSWKGTAPCWACGGVGVEDRELVANDRALWQFSTAYTGNFTEGEQQ